MSGIQNLIEFDFKHGILIKLPEDSIDFASIDFQIFTYHKTYHLFFDEYYFYQDILIGHQLKQNVLADGSYYSIDHSLLSSCSHVLIKPRINDLLKIAIPKGDKNELLLSIDFLFNENLMILENKPIFFGVYGKLLSRKIFNTRPEKSTTFKINKFKKILSKNNLNFSKNTSIVFNGSFFNPFAISLFLNYSFPLTFVDNFEPLNSILKRYTFPTSKDKLQFINYYKKSIFLEASFHDSYHYLATNNCLIIDLSTFNFHSSYLDVLRHAFDFYDRIFLLQFLTNNIDPEKLSLIFDFIKSYCKCDEKLVHTCEIDCEKYSLHEIYK